MDNYLTEWIGLSLNQVEDILESLGFKHDSSILSRDVYYKNKTIIVCITTKEEFGKQYLQLFAEKGNKFKSLSIPYYASQISQLITFEN